MQQGDWWPVTLHESDGCVWRGQVLPTPLTRLRWWRVCLDEAQMVETTTAKAAMIAVQLPRPAQVRAPNCSLCAFGLLELPFLVAASCAS